MTTPIQPNSQIPETPVLLYPSLAAKIGLEEATMLSVLTTVTRSYRGQENNNYRWYTLDDGIIGHLMPFWQAIDVQRVCTSLRDQGLVIIASAPYSTSKQLKFALNTKVSGNNVAESTAPSPAPQTNTYVGKTLLSPTWQPDRETLARLAQMSIPEGFALEQVPEFVTYWRGSGKTAESWGGKFFKHALHKWRDFETKQSAHEKTTLMTRNWRPSQDALEVLTTHVGISLAFIEDAIPEFELYWRERGDRSDNWNKKFRDHVNRQWLRYQSACEHDPTPRRISESWQPSKDVYDVLRLANIDIPFAQSLQPEFVIYWRDSNQVNSSWNTRFLQYVKQRWAKRDANGAPTNSRQTRDISIEEQLTDRSWAL